MPQRALLQRLRVGRGVRHRVSQRLGGVRRHSRSRRHSQRPPRFQPARGHNKMRAAQSTKPTWTIRGMAAFKHSEPGMQLRLTMKSVTSRSSAKGMYATASQNIASSTSSRCFTRRLTWCSAAGQYHDRVGTVLAARPQQQMVRRQSLSEHISRDYSTFTPASFTTFRQTSISFLIVARNCSGVPPAGETPSF